MWVEIFNPTSLILFKGEHMEPKSKTYIENILNDCVKANILSRISEDEYAITSNGQEFINHHITELAEHIKRNPKTIITMSDEDLVQTVVNALNEMYHNDDKSLVIFLIIQKEEGYKNILSFLDDNSMLTLGEDPTYH